ncbi:hypothetical protein Hanom_Chr16g01484621 [Helianthus anomalus]
MMKYLVNVAMQIASQILFNLPTEVKALNILDTPYSGQQAMLPLYESLGIEDVTTAEVVESLTKLMWPSGNQRFWYGFFFFLFF